MTRPANEAKRDQLLAGVRATDLPLSTDQAAETLPPYTVTHPCYGHSCVTNPAMTAVVSVICNGITHVKEMRSRGADAYPHLRILEERGLVVRVRFDNDRRVFWQAVGTDTVPVEELERMWSA